ncbi:hypothetical protein FOL47_008321, partial [Perkinsus chesapeaki]
MTETGKDSTNDLFGNVNLDDLAEAEFLTDIDEPSRAMQGTCSASAFLLLARWLPEEDLESVTSCLRGICAEIGNNSEEESTDPIAKEIQECLEGLIRTREKWNRSLPSVPDSGPSTSTRWTTVRTEKGELDLMKQIQKERKDKARLIKQMRHLKNVLDKLNLENVLLSSGRGGLKKTTTTIPESEQDTNPHRPCNDALNALTERANMTILQMAQRNADLRLENEGLREQMAELLAGGSKGRTQYLADDGRRGGRDGTIRRSATGLDDLTSAQRSQQSAARVWAEFGNPRRYSQLSATSKRKTDYSAHRPTVTTDEFGVQSLRYSVPSRGTKDRGESFMTPSTLATAHTRWPRLAGTTEAPSRTRTSPARLSRTDILEN